MAMSATEATVTANRNSTAATDIGSLPLSLLNLEQSVRDDITVIRESPLIPSSIPVREFISDVQNGLLTEIA